LKYGAIERVLMVAGAQFGARLNNFDPSEIGSVAHGRAPVSAQYREVQHLGVLAQSRSDRGAVIGPDRVAQSGGCRMRANARFEHCPCGETVFARDDELRVA
jgi:hypothetical protein